MNKNGGPSNGRTLCTRILAWDMGHRVLNHEGKCAMLHGHRYTAHLTCKAAELDDVGRVIDFGVIKQLVGQWVDDNWDHKTMLFREDTEMLEALPSSHVWEAPVNPTAENIAMMLWRQAHTALAFHGVIPTKVRIWETPNCYADYEVDAATAPGFISRE